MITNADARSLYRIGVLAASLAVVALLVGGVWLALSAAPATADAAQLLASINQKRLLFTIGSVAIVLVSLFDIFTVPGLIAALWRASSMLTGMGAIAAIVGDLLGVTSGLIQTALLPLSKTASGAASAAAETVVALESIFSTAGFMLVGVSFLLFGIAVLRGTFGKWIGWAAIAAGVFTLLGQLPVMGVLFMVANLAFLIWYIGLATRFARLARNA